jgi:hypothetical protein
MQWNKKILQYLQGMSNLELFFKKNSDPCLLGHTDVGYLSDPYNAKITNRVHVFTRMDCYLLEVF